MVRVRAVEVEDGAFHDVARVGVGRVEAARPDAVVHLALDPARRRPKLNGLGPVLGPIVGSFFRQKSCTDLGLGQTEGSSRVSAVLLPALRPPRGEVAAAPALDLVRVVAGAGDLRVIPGALVADAKVTLEDATLSIVGHLRVKLAN